MGSRMSLRAPWTTRSRIAGTFRAHYPLVPTLFGIRDHHASPSSPLRTAIRHPARLSLLVAECPLRVTRSHREGFPCCLLIPLAHMPSPLPRRDRSSVIARDSTGSGLPRRSGRSAPVLRVSRSARRSLTLWPACSLTPERGRLPKCFSPSRCLLEPLQVLPVGATSYRAGFAPAGINTPFHGTLTEARKPPATAGRDESFP